MDYKRKLACATLLTATAFSAPLAVAQTDRDTAGFFLGASYGGYKSHGGEFDDDNDLYGLSAGYQFNQFWALEADYVDFGKFGEDDVESELKGLALAVRGRFPVTDSFGVYGKVGAFASALDVDAFDEDETYDEVSPFVGAGIDFRVTHSLTAFAEYNRYNVDIDEDDFNGQVTNDGPEFDTARVGARYTF
ncbi:porin family protein [Marinobacter salicampi]|uniref:porin family protein n=1 Tax=Marinobacter salicampi TaxID=435907 RepID=UPI00140B7703|nr:porin family protein [Marinobacter salicampi]